MAHGGEQQRRGLVDLVHGVHELRVGPAHVAVLRRRRGDLLGGPGDREPGLGMLRRDLGEAREELAHGALMRLDALAVVAAQGVLVERIGVRGDHEPVRVLHLVGHLLLGHEMAPLAGRRLLPVGLAPGLREAPGVVDGLGAGEQAEARLAPGDGLGIAVHELLGPVAAVGHEPLLGAGRADAVRERLRRVRRRLPEAAHDHERVEVGDPGPGDAGVVEGAPGRLLHEVHGRGDAIEIALLLRDLADADEDGDAIEVHGLLPPCASGGRLSGRRCRRDGRARPPPRSWCGRRSPGRRGSRGSSRGPGPRACSPSAGRGPRACRRCRP